MKLNLTQIVELTGGCALTDKPGYNPDIIITGVATLSDAVPTEAAFLGNEKYFQDFLTTKAGLVLVPAGLPHYNKVSTFVEVANPSLAFNALVKYFMTWSYRFKPGVHPTAVIGEHTEFDPEKVAIGPYVVIGDHCSIGEGTDIGAGTCIGDGVTIGCSCRIHPRVVVRERCVLGNRVVLQPGCVIGADGFGYQLGPEGKYVGIEQAGIVELGDDVEIGANATVDRSRFGRTILGEDTKIDNLVQIGHNCTMGKHNVVCAQTGMAGSTHVGDYCTIAAQVGIAGHLTIGDQTVLAARTGVSRSLPGHATYWGTLAVPFKEAARQLSAVHKLPDVMKEFQDFKKLLEGLDLDSLKD